MVGRDFWDQHFWGGRLGGGVRGGRIKVRLSLPRLLRLDEPCGVESDVAKRRVFWLRRKLSAQKVKAALTRRIHIASDFWFSPWRASANFFRTGRWLKPELQTVYARRILFL